MNEDLNLKLAKLTGDFSEGYLDKNPLNAPDYLNDWNELMPLIFEHKIDIAECHDGYIIRYYVDDVVASLKTSHPTIQLDLVLALIDTL